VCIPSTSPRVATRRPGGKPDKLGRWLGGMLPRDTAWSRYARKLPISVSRCSGWCPRLALMVKGWSGWVNPAARAFGVSGLTRPLQSMRRPGRRGRGETDQGLVELAGDVALQAADDLSPAQALGGASVRLGQQGGYPVTSAPKTCYKTTSPT
jgi:hypothetical protein